MQVHAETNRPIFGKATPHGWDTIQVRSKSNPNKLYTVDITLGRCDCPAWKFQKGDRKPCKHLLSFGFKQVMQNSADIKEVSKQKATNKVADYAHEMQSL